MAQEKNALRAGSFIFGSLVLIIAIVIAIKGADRIFEPQQSHIVSFSLSQDVGGLRIGDDVRIGGFKVGVVRDIVIVTPAGESQGRVDITFSLPRKYVLRRDAHVFIQSTLTGASWLNFDNLGRGEPLPAEVPLAGHPSPTSEIISRVAEIAPQVEGLIGDLRNKTIPGVNDTVARIGKTADAFGQTGAASTRFIDHLYAQIDPAIEKYNQFTLRGAEMMVQVRDIIGDTKGDIRGTASNLNSVTRSLKTKLPGVIDKFDSALAEVDKTIQTANAALKDAQTMISNGREFTGAARSLLVDNRGKLDTMIASLKTASDNLKGASVEIRHSPWRLFYKPGPNDMANLNIYDSARQFADGASRLNDAAMALRDALHDPAVDREEIKKLMDQVEKSFNGFSVVEQKLWKSVKE